MRSSASVDGTRKEAEGTTGPMREGKIRAATESHPSPPNSGAPGTPFSGQLHGVPHCGQSMGGLWELPERRVAFGEREALWRTVARATLQPGAALRNSCSGDTHPLTLRNLRIITFAFVSHLLLIAPAFTSQ